MSSTPEERPIQALGPYGADPSLREGVRPRSPVGRADDGDLWGKETRSGPSDLAVGAQGDPEGQTWHDARVRAVSAPLRPVRLLVRCGVEERDLETAVLRRQLKILGRGGTRPRFTTADRAFLAAAARCSPGIDGGASWWARTRSPDGTGSSWAGARGPSRRPGRPPLDPSIKDLILRLGRENARWGYLRIRGELLKLGIDVSATTVATELRRGGLGPAPRRVGPTWAPFLRLHANGLLSRSPRSDEEDTREDLALGEAPESVGDDRPPPTTNPSMTTRHVREDTTSSWWALGRGCPWLRFHRASELAPATGPRWLPETWASRRGCMRTDLERTHAPLVATRNGSSTIRSGTRPERTTMGSEPTAPALSAQALRPRSSFFYPTPTRCSPRRLPRPPGSPSLASGLGTIVHCEPSQEGLSGGTAHISPRADSLLAGGFEAISKYVTPDLAYTVERTNRSGRLTSRPSRAGSDRTGRESPPGPSSWLPGGRVWNSLNLGSRTRPRRGSPRSRAARRHMPSPRPSPRSASRP